MTPEDLRETVERLRRQGSDDAEVEVKRCAVDLSSDVWESVSAFGNTHGGALILGLAEKNDFQPVKDFDVNKIIDQFVAGIGDGGQPGKLTNPPQYEIERHDLEGFPLLVVELKEVEVSLKPCYITARGVSNGSYKRVDDKDIKLSPTELYEMQNALIPSPADRSLVDGATQKDLDQRLIDDLIERAKSRNAKALRGVNDRMGQLERLNITGVGGGLCLAGLLVAGSYPQQYYPKFIVDVAVHPGVEKSTPDSPRFLDRVICEGPLAEVVDDAVHATAKNLRTFAVVKGTGRREELEIPEEVLREAIANAVVHREYSARFQGESVSVDVFSDRVEISNPGGLWGGKTLSNLADGSSRCRNEALMKLMTLVPLADDKGSPAEGNGSGVPYMIHEMESRALERPRFEVSFDRFKVILGRYGTEIAESRQWMKGLTDEALSHHEEAVLLYMRRYKKASVKEVRLALRFDSDEIREVFHKLAHEGVVAKVGPDEFRLSGESPFITGEEFRDAILSLFGSDETLGMRDIAAGVGQDIEKTRYQVRRLVTEGRLVPTAVQTSKNRKYRKSH